MPLLVVSHRPCCISVLTGGLLVLAPIGAFCAESAGPTVYPLRVNVPEVAAANIDRITALCGTRESDSIPAQPVAIGPPHMRGLWGLLPDPAPNNPKPIFGKTAQPSPFRFEDKDGRLTLYEGTKPVFSYIYTMHLQPGVPENRRRSSYVHPLYGLDGEVITDDFPADHYHHRGIFWTWPHVRIGQQSYDQWTIRGANHRFDRWLERETGPVCAVFGVENLWVVGDKPVLRETVWFQVFRAARNVRIIDVALTLHPLAQDVTLGGRQETGYGGFCLRAGKRKNTVLTVPKGILEKDDNLTPFDWADLSAQFDGRSEVSGAAIFPHPQNPDVPNGWTLRHYGFLGVAWPGKELHTIPPDKLLTLRYRLAIHRGPANVPDLSRAYELYSKPSIR